MPPFPRLARRLTVAAAIERPVKDQGAATVFIG